MIYIDTSALIPLYVPEARSGETRDILAAAEAPLTISFLTYAEARSALALRVRNRSLAEHERQRIAKALDSDIAADFEIVSVIDADFTAAARLLDKSESALRASDAIHIAVTARLGATLLSYDRQMLKAAQSLGIKIVA